MKRGQGHGRGREARAVGTGGGVDGGVSLGPQRVCQCKQDSLGL